MQKSFHIQLIRPFYKNIRKEITKMPKVFFYDLGVRNALLNNFENFEFRTDKGSLLENLFFRALLEKYQIEHVRFWRSLNVAEVDFVVDDLAFEIKTSKKTTKQSKYKSFNKKFPNIKFNILDQEDIIANYL